MSEKASIQGGEGKDDAERQRLANAEQANESLRLEARQSGRGQERASESTSGNSDFDQFTDGMREKFGRLPNDNNGLTSQEHVRQVMSEWATFFAGGVDALMGRKELTEAQQPHQQLMKEFALNLDKEDRSSVNELLNKLYS